jgi:hypothetical protein
VSDLSKTRPMACPRCKATMDPVVRIAPVAGERRKRTGAKRNGDERQEQSACPIGRTAVWTQSRLCLEAGFVSCDAGRDAVVTP